MDPIDRDPMLPHEDEDRIAAAPQTVRRSVVDVPTNWWTPLLVGLAALVGLWLLSTAFSRATSAFAHTRSGATGLAVEAGYHVLRVLAHASYAVVGFLYARGRRSDKSAAEMGTVVTGGLVLITTCVSLGMCWYYSAAYGRSIPMPVDFSWYVIPLSVGYVGGLIGDGLRGRSPTGTLRVWRAFSPLTILLLLLCAAEWGSRRAHVTVGSSGLSRLIEPAIIAGLVTGLAMLGTESERQSLWRNPTIAVVVGMAVVYTYTSRPPGPDLLWTIGLPMAAAAYASNWLVRQFGPWEQAFPPSHRGRSDGAV